MFPDVNGKMVRIPIAHTYEQCRKNGRHLGYPDGDSRAWCTQHCAADKNAARPVSLQCFGLCLGGLPSAEEVPQHVVDGIWKFDLRKVADAVEDFEFALR